MSDYAICANTTRNSEHVIHEASITTAALTCSSCAPGDIKTEHSCASLEHEVKHVADFSDGAVFNHVHYYARGPQLITRPSNSLA